MPFSWTVSTASQKGNGKWYEWPWFGREAERFWDEKEWLAVYRDSRVMSWSRYGIIIKIIIIYTCVWPCVSRSINIISALDVWSHWKRFYACMLGQYRYVIGTGSYIKDFLRVNPQFTKVPSVSYLNFYVPASYLPVGFASWVLPKFYQYT